ncbi:hypothetical protein [Myxacorys almedinensis]|uniref:Uncharacterized protein n=1 Tax=Myxacorys almedinensis A TaxID=2690445 RepID=A0A8J7Z248_9CYAN|nr:hypothetical protein [Myxacorys almedinensis]NDJ18972.1 hypothetical protein [Myxacorys almedinensis A]
MKQSKLMLLLGLMLLTFGVASWRPLSVIAREAIAPQVQISTHLNFAFPSKKTQTLQLGSPLLLAQTDPAPTNATPSGRVRIQEVWRQVYERLPNFPLENQYVNRQTRKVDATNTLASRLIRYHYYVKGRPVNYRLDWKVTLADYLGINEPIDASTYPSADNLEQNPLERDRDALTKLDRHQRNALIQALVDSFSPSDQGASTPAASPAPRLLSTPPSQPSSGGAQLLK